ncbi:MAG: hypothetical protein DMF88_17465 [Acidobacteria bacterium]|nr:MAG: hypothetical protein DMF88_17465 [Acidobacteriota bacterium]
MGAAGDASDANEPRRDLPARDDRRGAARGGGRGGGAMSNILAIAQKELKGYFATPIGYIVIGMFALLWGWFYYVMLIIFNQQSLQLGGLEGGNADINSQLIRPLFLNASVILLFVLPLVTMRIYSEEKRSGTIELLLTSPLTDVQIIIGKFLGAMTLYAAMLAITAIHVGLLFSYGNPEWRVVVIGYLGLLLMRDDYLRRVPDAVGHQLAGIVCRSEHAEHPELPVDHRTLRRLHEGDPRHQAPGLLLQRDGLRAVPDRALG